MLASISSIAATITAAEWQAIGGLALSAIAVVAAPTVLRDQKRAGGMAKYGSPRDGGTTSAATSFTKLRGGNLTPGQKGEPMATEDKRHQFEQIVERLTTDYPSLSRAPRRDWRRPVLVAVLIAAGLAWGLLSVAMVVWGTLGIALTCALVTTAAIGVAVDARRRL